MGVIDAPQWLLPAFVRSVRALGASAEAEQIEDSCEALIRSWSTPERRFHNLRHVIDMLARVDELAAESHNPDVIRVATWYHGCVFSLEHRQTYQRNGGEDEVASAAEAARDLTALGVPEATVERIGQLILSLKRHNLDGSDIDAMALNDADLGTLACGPQLYKTYRQQVRAEYEHVPDLDYYQARRAIIDKLLSREKLFSSPLGMRWELPARENLRYELRLVDAKLAELEAPGAAPAAVEETTRAEPPQAQALAPEEQAARSQQSQRYPAQVSPSAGAGVAEGADADTLENVDLASSLSAPPPPHPPAPVPASASSPTPGGAVTSATPAEAPAPQAASATSVASAVSAASAAPAPSEPAPEPSRVEAPARDTSPAEAVPEHTTTMESCAADIDELLAKQADPEAPLTRQEQAQAQRDRVYQLAQAKSEAAKALRESRTGSLPPVPEEIASASTPVEP